MLLVISARVVGAKRDTIKANLNKLPHIWSVSAAQLVERPISNPAVIVSNPTISKTSLYLYLSAVCAKKLQMPQVFKNITIVQD